MTRRPQPGGTRRDEAGVVAPSRVMLVVIVLVAIGAATYVAGLGSGSKGSDSDVASTASARETPSASASASSSASASASATASPSASATPSESATPSATAKPSAKPSATASAQPVRKGTVSVSVFNNSSRTGLGARTSDKVKGAGWKVIGTDNWYGSIPQPTVYYPPALKAAAQLLAKDAGIDRVKPAVSPMRGDRLTLIVTADYRL